MEKYSDFVFLSVFLESVIIGCEAVCVLICIYINDIIHAHSAIFYEK